MKQKNGFTLVELVATLVLMIALGLLITSNVVGMLGRQNDKSYIDFKEKIESAACSYAASHIENSKLPIDLPIKTLVEEGLVGEDEKNPKTDQVVNQSNTIKIKMDSGVRTCTYQETEG